MTEAIIGCAIELHKEFGPGLLHSVYQLCLGSKLLERNFSVEIDRPVSLSHGTFRFDKAFKADLVVDNRVIVEVKTIKTITDIDVAQLLTYLRLMDIRIGLIINFNVTVLTRGVRRVVNRYVDENGNLI